MNRKMMLSILLQKSINIGIVNAAERQHLFLTEEKGMKKLKNVLAVTLSAAMLLSLVACDNLGSSSKKSKKDSDDTDAVVEAAEDYTKVLKDFDLKKKYLKNLFVKILNSCQHIL